MHKISIESIQGMLRLSIQADEAGMRLDRYLTTVLPDVSRTVIQKLIEDREVLVNGHISKSGYALKMGDRVQLESLDMHVKNISITPNSLPLDIIYEDEDLLVVNKAAGMVVHPAPGHRDDTLVNALAAYDPNIVREDSGLRPGIIHRLDKDTSGLIIIAKNAVAHSALASQMKRHEVIKRYLALVEGVVALDHGSIDAPIGRDPRHRQQMAVTVVKSRQACTHFRVQQRFSRHTLLLLELETGRTHQIRVHLRAIGHPVLGDPVYGSGNINRGLSLGRQFLHAFQLVFTHPTTGDVIHLEAPLPEDLQAILERKSFL